MPVAHERGIESYLIRCPNCGRRGVEYDTHSVTVREEVHHILRCRYCYWEYCWHNTADFRIFCQSVLKLGDASVSQAPVPV